MFKTKPVAATPAPVPAPAPAAKPDTTGMIKQNVRNLPLLSLAFAGLLGAGIVAGLVAYANNNDRE